MEGGHAEKHRETYAKHGTPNHRRNTRENTARQTEQNNSKKSPGMPISPFSSERARQGGLWKIRRDSSSSSKAAAGRVRAESVSPICSKPSQTRSGTRDGVTREGRAVSRTSVDGGGFGETGRSVMRGGMSRAEAGEEGKTYGAHEPDGRCSTTRRMRAERDNNAK